MLRLFYRISDASYKKPKLPGVTKEVCLKNFLWAFKEIIFSKEVFEGVRPPITILADNVSESKHLVTDTGLPVIATDLGNAGSLIYALELALERNSDDTLVYFCEDDYLHLPHAIKLLEEGLQVSDYVTLYDHPDKYTSVYDFGEVSKVFRTKSSHWRHTQSTCMTFGTRVGVLREDLEVWKKHVDGNHPHDHKIFTELGTKGRKLSVSIPGVACHTDLTFSGHAHSVLMDEWALELLIQDIAHKLNPAQAKMRDSVVKEGMGSWDRLKLTHACQYT